MLMEKQKLAAVALSLALGAPALFGQTPAAPAQRETPPSPQQSPQRGTQPPRPTDDEVVRITTNLVQVDAVVTDKDGKVVTDLSADDFEMLEEGRVQPITNFSFVPLQPDAVNTSAASAASSAPSPAAKKGSVPPPSVPVRLRPEQVRRAVALVVDDLAISQPSVERVRDALKKFVDEQVQPGDLVAIFRTRGGSGALQQFTTDKAQLRRVIQHLRWSPPVRGLPSAFDAARMDYTMKPHGEGQSSFEDARSREAREGIEADEQDRLVSDAIGVVRHLVLSLEKMPGRKSVVLFSDGVRVRTNDGRKSPLRGIQSLERLVDAATRASVVLYAIDARGLVDPYSMTAADNATPFDELGSTSTVRAGRANELFESQNGMSYMAEATGGLFVHSANDLGRALGRVLADQRGYYLIGYRPDEATFKKSGFRKISVRVKRPGLRVRTRKGFYSVSEEASRPARPRTLDQQLYDVLASPLSSGDISLRLTSLFGDDARTGLFVRSLINIDPREITFTDERDGWKKLALDVAAVTFGENGKIVGEFNRTHTIRIGPDTFRHVEANGLYYTADVPVEKPGAYQLRFVVRDAASKRVGSASQYVEVPDLKKQQLALSGIVLTEADPQGAPQLPPAASAEAALAPNVSPAGVAVRRFRPGALLSFAHLIYNPRLAPSTRQPQLTTQLRVFRDGKEIFTGKETPFDIGRQLASTRFSNDGTLRLRPDAPPGDYVLQIVVNDTLPGERRRTATQWIDFEVRQ
jgi:VWFA-related protein